MFHRTAVYVIRMPGGVGGAGLRGLPLSRFRRRRLSNRPMKSAIAELREAQEDLQSIADRIAAEPVAGPLAALKRTGTEIGEAWSGSFLGYHALVYYKDLKPPPPGAHFSSEWGLRDAFNMGTRGAWEEWGFDAVKNEILRQAGSPDLTQVRETSTALREHFEERHAQILSVLETTIARRKDPFLERLLEDAKKTGPITPTEYIRYQQPPGV